MNIERKSEADRQKQRQRQRHRERKRTINDKNKYGLAERL